MTRHLTLGALVTVALATVTLVPGSAQEERAVTIQSMDVRDNLVNNGGSGVAYPETLEAIVAAFDDITRVIPGHIPLPSGSPIYGSVACRPSCSGWTTWEDLVQYAQFNRDFLDAVRASHAAGRSVPDAVAALDLWDRYPEYGQNRAEANVEAIYDELGR